MNLNELLFFNLNANFSFRINLDRFKINIELEHVIIKCKALKTLEFANVL